MIQNEEFIQDFIDEANVHIENVDAGLLQMDKNGADSETINGIFRAVHSIKGTAGFFGLSRIVQLSHAMENLFGEIRSGKMPFGGAMVDRMLVANDCLRAMVADVQNSEQVDISAYLADIGLLLQNGPDAAALPTAAQTEPPVQAPSQTALADNESQIIQEALKHGHRVFRVHLKVNEVLGKKNLNPITFFKKIEGIGNIVTARTDISAVKTLEEFTGNDPGEIGFDFLFTTVLEKSLLPLALDIPEADIEEIGRGSDAVTGSPVVATVSADARAISPEEGLPQSTGNYLQREAVPVKTENGNTTAAPLPAEAPTKEETDLTAAKGRSITAEDNVRVHVTLLNNLLNLASEMVLSRNQLLRTIENYRKSVPGLEPILQNIDRVTTELQENIMLTRMQPVGNIFNKFPRIIRDLSHKLDKEVELRLEGTEVELDKSIIEALSDPLTHLVRNAVDHGLEKGERREAAGKSRVGLVVLKAYHEGGYVNIDIMDDGAGLNLERIKQKALEKGIVTKAELASLSESEITHLLFKPGFSTAEAVTDVSGRGVGMDVVKTNVEKLGGMVEIFSEPEHGTTVRLSLPLTLAIIPSLIVEVEGQKFALPQVNLQEIVRIKPGDTQRKIEYIHNSQVLRLRGRLLPIVRLADILGIPRTYLDPYSGERRLDRRLTLYDRRMSENGELLDAAPPEAGRERNAAAGGAEATAAELSSRRLDLANIIRILVLQIGSKRFGIAVDAVFGREEILVKPLPEFIKDCQCFSGVTILGDGKTALIIDPEGIIAAANLRFNEDDQALLEEQNGEEMREQQNLLLFKCSGPETFAIDMTMVARVEEVKSQELERIGNRLYLKYRDQSLRLVRPEDYLGVFQGEQMAERLYVVIPKLIQQPMGILVEKIYDTLKTTVGLNQENIRVKGIIGSAILQERIVLLLNLYELFELADPERYQPVANIEPGKAGTVLLVEDTPFFQKMERNYLEMAGYSVIAASNGQEAWNVLQSKPVDIVVSDIQMPCMDGLELVKKIREHKSLARIPVIAVTSMTGEAQKKIGLEAGFDDYEYKLDRNSLLGKIAVRLAERGRKEAG